MKLPPMAAQPEVVAPASVNSEWRPLETEHRLLLRVLAYRVRAAGPQGTIRISGAFGAAVLDHLTRSPRQAA